MISPDVKRRKHGFRIKKKKKKLSEENISLTHVK